MAKGTGKKFLQGTLIGAAVGAVAGLLFAPKSGKQTRQDIKKGTLKAHRKASRSVKKVRGTADDISKDAQELVKKTGARASAFGKSVRDKAKRLR